MKREIEIDGVARQVSITQGDAPHAWHIQIDGESVDADACFLRPGVLSLLLDGRSHRIVLDGDAADPALFLHDERIAWQADDPRSLRRRRRHITADGPVTLKASMPGRVVRVLVRNGDHVAAHQAVIVIEAMKMQNEMKSPREGRVADLRVAPGATVASGEVLAVIE